MTPQQIKYVLTLTEEGSFSKAANKLFITQPSLSQYIANIEKQLGDKLFDRTTKPIRLTTLGRAYVETAKKISAIENNFSKIVDEIRNLENGELNIGTSTFRTAYLLPRSISEYHANHPGIQIHIIENEWDYLLEKLKNGDIDLIIGADNGPLEEYDVEVLASERVYLAIPKAFPINQQLQTYCLDADDICNCSQKFLLAKTVSPEKLKHMPFILSSRNDFECQKIEDAIKAKNCDPTNIMLVKTVDAAFALTNAGLGISLIPDSFIRFGNFRQHPCYYALPDEISRGSICLYTRKESQLSVAAKEYSQTLKRLVCHGTWKVAP